MAATETAPMRRDPAPMLPLFAMLGVAAALLLVFWVLKHAPPDYDCDEGAPASQAARLADYRAGLRGLHVAAALLLIAALVWASRERALYRGRSRPGRPTLVAAAIAVVWAVACLVDDDVAAPLLVAGLVSLLLSPLVLLATLVLLAIVWRHREAPPRWCWPVIAGVGWIATFLLVPGHAALVLLQGDPICLG